MSINRINYYVKAAKEYGIVNCLKRVAGTCVYRVVSLIYKSYLMNCTKVNENKIVFCSKPSFSDNAKAMYDYIIGSDQGKKYQYVWLIGHKEEISESENSCTALVRRHTMYHDGMTLKALKETATAKYVFFTHSSPLSDFGKTRKEQIVINLWHGCGYKDIQKSSASWIERNPCDYSLVPGDVFVKTKSGFWGCKEEEIWPIGYPRYDYLLKESKNAERYANRLKADAKKLIVWMPTFRKTRDGKFPESKIKYNFELPLLESAEQLLQLNHVLSEKKMVLCVKRHPSQLVYECEKYEFSNIKFINNDNLRNEDVELYEFIHYTDALISDYSSVAVDYLLLHKPMAFSLDDYEEYKNTRGFVFENPLEYMPGYHLYGYKDMLIFLNDVSEGKDPYAGKRDSIMEIMHHPCENYSKRVWEKVKDR